MVSLREKVQFRMNQPVKVALAYEDGVFKQDDRFGDYWMYTLEDQRIMFVPPVVHEQIKQRRIESGQKFTITKVPARCGHRRGLDWVVDVAEAERQSEHSSDEAAEVRPAVVEDSNQERLAGEPVASDTCKSGGEVAPFSKAEVSGDKPPADVAQSEIAGQPNAENVGAEAGSGGKPNGTAKSNGSGYVNGTATKGATPNGAGGDGLAKPTGGRPAIKPRTSPLFKAAMQAAIDAMIEGEQYASERNYCVRFTSEDLRASAISIFISMRDGGYR